MAGICCYAPDGSRARLCFHAQPDSYNDHTLIEVLKQLRRFLRGRPATLIWDNLPSHHNRVMRDWLTSQRHWLQVEYLPAYAHDLDPVEGLWANLKGVELANLTCDTVAECWSPPSRAPPGSVGNPRCCSPFSGVATWVYEIACQPIVRSSLRPPEH
jgi:hypothetical protein